MCENFYVRKKLVLLGHKSLSTGKLIELKFFKSFHFQIQETKVTLNFNRLFFNSLASVYVVHTLKLRLVHKARMVVYLSLRYITLPTLNKKRLRTCISMPR